MSQSDDILRSVTIDWFDEHRQSQPVYGEFEFVIRRGRHKFRLQHSLVCQPASHAEFIPQQLSTRGIEVPDTESNCDPRRLGQTYINETQNGVDSIACVNGKYSLLYVGVVEGTDFNLLACHAEDQLQFGLLPVMIESAAQECESVAAVDGRVQKVCVVAAGQFNDQ